MLLYVIFIAACKAKLLKVLPFKDFKKYTKNLEKYQYFLGNNAQGIVPLIIEETFDKYIPSPRTECITIIFHHFPL